MQKRGQITVFIIIGLLLVIGLGTVVYVTQRGGAAADAAQQQAELSDPTTQTNAIIQGCLQQEGVKLLQALADKGGTFAQGRLYKQHEYAMHCVETGIAGCVNTLRTKQDIAAEYDAALVPALNECMDFSILKQQGYEVSPGAIVTNSIITFEKVTTTVDFPLTLRKGNDVVMFDQFIIEIESPIGKLHSLAQALLNQHAQKGYFDKDTWMQQHGVDVLITIQRPYPDTLIELADTDNVGNLYLFHFGQKGIPTSTTVTDPRPAPIRFPQCLIERDCFDNVPEDLCTSKGGEIVEVNDARCKQPFKRDDLCDGRACKNCIVEGKEYLHGQQWCGSTAERQTGLDPVGSRFGKLSCIDGNVLVEPCRDFREEFCTEDPAGSVGCRQNRWWDCWQQDAATCEDASKRDCFWTGGLIPSPSIKFLNPPRSNGRCRPVVAPGLMHWKKSAKKVCSLGNEQVREDIGVFSEAISWKPPVVHANGAAQFCYSLGDCGNKASIAGRSPKKRFKSTTGKPNKALAFPATNEMPRLLLDAQLFPGITAATFDYPEGNKDFMKARTQDYIAWLLSLDIMSVLMDMQPLHIVHSTYCKGWMAQGKKKPQLCDQCDDNFLGCSQYVCRTLGRLCRFSINAQGEPVCSERNEPPIKVKVNFPDLQYKKTSGGYEILTPLNPYQEVDMVVTSDRPVLCTLSPIPGEEDMLDSDDPELSAEVTLLRVMYDALLASTMQSDAFTADWRDPDVEQHMNMIVPDLEFLKSFTEDVSVFSVVANPSQVTNFLSGSFLDDFFNNPVFDGNPAARQGLEKWTDSAQKAFGEKSGLTGLGSKVQMLLAFNDIRKDPRIATLFLTCSDDAGDATDTNIVIKATVIKDVLPPDVLNVTPEPPAHMPASMTLKLNEPAECRYALDSDKGFLDMTEMECKKKRFERHLCTADFEQTGAHTVFVKCRDRPYAFLQGELVVKKDGSDSFATGGILAETGGQVNFTVAPFALEATIDLSAEQDSSQLSINFQYDYLCKYGEERQPFDVLPRTMQCNENSCKTTLDTSASTTYYFACADLDGPYQNMNSRSFTYEYSS